VTAQEAEAGVAGVPEEIILPLIVTKRGRLLGRKVVIREKHFRIPKKTVGGHPTGPIDSRTTTPARRIPVIQVGVGRLIRTETPRKPNASVRELAKAPPQVRQK
jgi:hypothetical protein